MKKIVLLITILLILSGCSAKSYDGEVNVLNWTSYIPQEVIRDFENEYNIKVNYGTYSSNEELLAKISSSSSGTYDLIFPSDYMIELMIERDMIEPLDKTKLNNIDNINSLFLKQKFDKTNKYSLPFLAATTTIVVNRKNIKDPITSYNDLLKEEYKNNIIILDDQRIVIGMALQANGYSMNETDKDKLDNAKKWLLKLNKNIKAFDSDSPKTFLITNEVDLGVIWNAEAIIAKEENESIEIIYPKDGFALSLDNYAIVKKAKNKDNAYKFIDYLLRDDVSKKITEEYPYINTNKNCQNVSTDELKYILDNATYVENIGSNISTYDKIWAEIK
ncbi:MAG: spermidine/putrescine ABC transporter substrate-binding protein [Bacilli bacterium]|nr:spermidine/putrescine ABC transporter substrate-binding protein [Bacilli bacterium]